MQIDIRTEEILSLAAAARWWGERTGSSKSATTLWRWARKGVLAADGSRVRLDVLDDGQRLKTSVEALQRLVDRLAAARATAERGPAIPGGTLLIAAARTPGQEEALRELEAMGA